MGLRHIEYGRALSYERALLFYWRQLADGDYWEVSELEVRVTVAPELA